MATTEDTRLKPWQPLPTLTCEYCPAQVTRRVSSLGTDLDGDDAWLRYHTTTHTQPPVLTCDYHADQARARICEADGASASDQLRSTWTQYWLYQQPLTKWIGRIEIAIHNWRFDRASNRIANCDHQLDEHNNCRRCGCHFLN